MDTQQAVTTCKIDPSGFQSAFDVLNCPKWKEHQTTCSWEYIKQAGDSDEEAAPGRPKNS